jgi:hypothetical protein
LSNRAGNGPHLKQKEITEDDKAYHITNNRHDTKLCHSINISLEITVVVHVIIGNIMIYLGFPINIPPACAVTLHRKD